MSYGISGSDWRKLLIAAKIAENSQHHQFRHGAIVVKSGRVLGRGTNVVKSHPEVYQNRSSLHAEAVALADSPITEGVTVYVVRLDAQDNLAMSAPCRFCLEQMWTANVSKVIFSASESTAGMLRLARLNLPHRHI